ncbi:hypothetical protein F5Y18DRAFT_76077 [Xylariaceae sp. FL1019]|nr:hypothetical protein F5Y18DRAFT_76077 [Xylariaceae sp. FL1019]
MLRLNSALFKRYRAPHALNLLVAYPLHNLLNTYLKFFRSQYATMTSTHSNASSEQIVEDFPPGYPRLASLVGSHPSFHVFRRFSAVRARMLLYQQDKISQLEEELEAVDQTEQKALFHGARRRDMNPERRALISQLKLAMADYDDLLIRTREALSAKPARPRDVNNLHEWIKATGCLSREEFKYLQKQDLMAVVPFEPDGLLESLSGWVEDLIIWTSSKIRMNLRTSQSRDENMHIFSDSLIKKLTRVILTFVASITILIPIIASSLIVSAVGRLALVAFAIPIFMLVLSLAASPRASEIFVAGAAYAAVVVVYVSNSET